MKTMLDGSGCISCGLCAEAYPGVLHVADDGVAKVCQEDVPESAEATVVETQRGCPVSIITIG